MRNWPTLAHLPTLARFEAAPGQGAALFLEDAPAGYDFLPPRAPASLLPLPDGSGVLLDNWKDPRRAYRVPAHLCGPLARALSLRRVEA
ncbi:hypothetical protein QOL99_02990 [Deinococcus sp. MIMF12]|uniref:Uncharacterized protein n=1 Tax=Deinococcus rhizophilus TaxID=3049544 RepID=A0ABT7JDH6_9DEIO|nr:hypothetical protein [Deinococcus rhizophilus]MDL2343111.1 hypothetical protein [Deinococcus rhizophilus]